MPHADARISSAGTPIDAATGAIILLHGRGGSADDILSLGSALVAEQKGIALIAPQAANHTWYPYSFLAPIAQNEPYLTSAITLIESIVEQVLAEGIAANHIAIAGFSQGACLSTEFVARHPRHYAALLAFTGGLIGPPDADLTHTGNLNGMPALLSSGDPDPHVPWQRVEDSARVLTAMGAKVETVRHPGRPHTILASEVDKAREILKTAF